MTPPSAEPERWKLLKPETLRVLIREDICPECLGQLDTGYECNSCNFDAIPVVQIVKSWIAVQNRRGECFL